MAGSSGGNLFLNCTIHAEGNIKVLHSALIFLSKINNDVTLEVLNNEIILRALNDAKSSFAAVSFERDFFTDLQTTSTTQNLDAPPGNISQTSQAVKQRTSALFNARALANAIKVSKNLVSAQLYFAIQGANHVFVVVLKQRNNVTRTHSLTYNDTEIIQAVFDRETAKNSLIGPPMLIERLVGRIQGTDEVSLLALSGCAQMQGFHESGIESTVRGAVHTSVALETSVFDKFVISLSQTSVESQQVMPLNVTFSVREVRHLISFSKTAGIDSEELAVFFDDPGSPVLFSTRGVVHKTFKADLIVATLEQSVQPATGSPLAVLILGKR
jgi:hypothetical protein